MLITKLFNKHKHVQRKKKMQSELDQCCAIFVEPLVVHYNVCKTVDGTHFVRNLIKGLAYQD